ncbi:glycoside hydrolase family 88 protein [candidate division CSSED10-310 bacterium]|uniref:Glycoside hydrolase family 88 protein n=1 Tax=candidate division CSSED10-310 bacterium TaxID=2855610 RepID=A0ABV6YW77_UNCC1
MVKSNHISPIYLQIFCVMGFFCLLGIFSCHQSDTSGYQITTFTDVIPYAESQLGRTDFEVPYLRYPYTTGFLGKWQTAGSEQWCSGFHPGCLWLLLEATSNHDWLAKAARRTAGLTEQQHTTGTHDVGFIIFTSFSQGYRLTKNDSYKGVILQAAHSLATRYNPVVGCIRSWDQGTFPVIVDGLMNLEILFWAAKHGGGAAFAEMAHNHALRTMSDHVRSDGSTYHVVEYNPQSGEVLKKYTHQGFSDESTWSRGQAWAIAGFTQAYGETGDDRLLETARKVARYFIDNLPPDQIPYWDFDLPEHETRLYRDSSAAAIAAFGLLELSALEPEAVESSYFKDRAVALLSSLTFHYLTVGTTNRGLLLHAAYNVPSGDYYAQDSAAIWGDYYYLASILKVIPGLSDPVPETGSEKSHKSRTD